MPVKEVSPIVISVNAKTCAVTGFCMIKEVLILFISGLLRHKHRQQLPSRLRSWLDADARK